MKTQNESSTSQKTGAGVASPPAEFESKKRAGREYNYKSSRSGQSKTIPSFATQNTSSPTPCSDAEFLRLQQNNKMQKERQNNGGKIARTSAKNPPSSITQQSSQQEPKKPLIDVRKTNKLPEKIQIPPKKEKEEPKTPQPTRPPKPTVSFAMPPPPPKEAFRPPTPIPFMHRVNSLPYVSAPDNDPFNIQQVTDSFVDNVVEDNSMNFDENVFFTPVTSRSCTPFERNISNPMLIPQIDIPLPQYSSGSSRQLSPSFRDRSPTPPLILQPKKSNKNILIISIIILLVIIIICVK